MPIGHYPLYHSASSLWGQALDEQDALLARKAALLQGLGPVGGFKRMQSKSFPRGARLQVTLTLEGTPDPADPIEITIGGARATHVGQTNTYVLNAAATRHMPDGSLSLVLRLRSG